MNGETIQYVRGLLDGLEIAIKEPDKAAERARRIRDEMIRNTMLTLGIL